MASSLVKIDIHLVFHVKSTGIPMRKEDLPRIFQYIGGVIKGMDGIPIVVGGIEDHIHILASLPKTMALTDFVRNIKANSSKQQQMDQDTGLLLCTVLLAGRLWGFFRQPVVARQDHKLHTKAGRTSQ